MGKGGENMKKKTFQGCMGTDDDSLQRTEEGKTDFYKRKEGGSSKKKEERSSRIGKGFNPAAQRRRGRKKEL